MKYLSKTLLKRWSALTGVVVIFGVSVLSVLASIIAAQPVRAQAAYTWINMGAITHGDETFYDKNPYDDIREFGLYGIRTCDYPAGNPPIKDLPYDRLIVKDSSNATRYTIDESIKDNVGNPTCTAKSTNVTLTNTNKAAITLYRTADTVSNYNNTQSFNKVASSANPEIFVRTGETGAECADILVHGTSGDYNGWFIFPMASKDHVKNSGEPGTAVSERYAGLTGVESSKERCRVASMEIETVFKMDARISSGYTPCDPSQDPSCTGGSSAPWLAWELTGIDQNIFAYANHIVPGGWGDDGYLIKNGVGDESSAPPANAPPPGGEDGDTGTPTPNTCDVAFSVVDILALKWIVCPVLDGLFGVVGVIDDLINSQLKLDMSPFNNGTPYHTVWNTFRVLALGVLVISVLVMVVAQATGLEILSAYTIRTLAGSIVVVTVFITMSWPLTLVIFTAVGEIAEGAKIVILAPFGQFPAEQLSGGSSISLALLGSGAILFLGPIGLLSLVGSYALIVGSALLMIGLLHALTYMMAITAPLWIALALLPGTRPAFKFASSLYGVCAMLGIIIVVIVNGMRAISIGIYHIGGTVNQITGLVIYIISAGIVTVVIIKFAGAATQIFTGVQGVFSKASGALSKVRKNQVSKNWDKMATGERFKRNYLGFNSATKGIAAFARSNNKSAFFSPDYETRRSARQFALNQHRSIMSARKGKTEEAQYAQYNDDINQAWAAGKTEHEARRNLQTIYGYSAAEANRRVLEAKQLGDFSDSRQIDSFHKLVQSGTGFKSNKQMYDSVYAIAGNNTALADQMLAKANQDTKNAGAYGFAAGAGAHSKMYKQRVAQKGSLNAQQERQLVVSAMLEADPMAIGRSKGAQVEMMAEAGGQAIPEFQNIVHDTTGAYTDAQKEEARTNLVKLVGLTETLKQSSPYFSANNTERLAAGMGAPTADARVEVQQNVQSISEPYVMKTVFTQPTPAQPTPTVITVSPSGQTQQMSGSLAGPAPGPAPAPAPAPTMAGVGGRQPVVAYYDRSGNPVYERNPNHNKDDPMIEKAQWHIPGSRMPYNRDVHDPK
ncbi:MAG TPA: hypothetical protein VF733_02940 [Candidatus Saccharimonadales bacterium]